MTAWGWGVSSVDGIADLLKLPARISAAIAAAAALILFLPQDWLTPLGLDSLAKDHRGWVGVVFLLAVLLFLAEISVAAWQKIQAWRAEKKADDAADVSAPEKSTEKQERAFHARLSRLTGDEKELLRMYVESDVRSLTLPFRNGTVMGLVGQSILMRPNQFLNFETREPSAETLIQPWALEHLKKHPELLE